MFGKNIVEGVVCCKGVVLAFVVVSSFASTITGSCVVS